LKKGKRKQAEELPHVNINGQIRAKELRVIGFNGENYGVISTKEALDLAKEAGADLIEISPGAQPPVAKIMDYGKFQYDQKKKIKVQKAKAHNVEVKGIQIKVGTDENDLNIKAKKASEWLNEGHRVKIELFLPGRTRFLDETFLNERIGRILKLITVEYRVAEEIKKVPKGLSTMIEKAKK
jgi:translation initiation factor IF-3